MQFKIILKVKCTDADMMAYRLIEMPFPPFPGMYINFRRDDEDGQCAVHQVEAVFWRVESQTLSVHMKPWITGMPRAQTIPFLDRAGWG